MLHRLKQFIDYKNINISSFEKKVGMSNASISKPFKNGGTIGVDKLENIIKVFPELDVEWLVTGNGEMIKNVKTYPPIEKYSIIEDDLVRYNNTLAIKEKEIEDLNRLVKEKDVRIEEKEKQLKEKDSQIKELLTLLNNKEHL
jgi:transcriptional regulator with XRE-family HTH domain